MSSNFSQIRNGMNALADWVIAGGRVRGLLALTPGDQRRIVNRQTGICIWSVACAVVRFVKPS